MSENSDKLRELVAEVAAAYFSNSHVSVGEIPSVVTQIAASLSAVGDETSGEQGEAEPAAAQPKLTPAQVRKSVTNDGLISFEDGRGYKTLKRHLSVRGLTPAAYREKWGLPRDYPMVAPSYSAKRSALAKSLGLGQQGVPRVRKAVATPRKIAAKPKA
ncbi:MAG TPA: MucR family transcriptional regulator [Caulobacteraceae bacterium]|jgi:predicted transcriptional regulator|nr:MucR family transcriptional regulator [Caulobacteraceae bacterium]